MAWISKYNTWLTEAESMNNAQEVVNFLYGQLKWSKQATAAICGNMRHESSINPDVHEFGYGDDPSRGYGIVQWTPKTKLTEWATSVGLKYKDGVTQLKRIQYEADTGIQYYPTVSYPETFPEFQQSTKSIEYLTNAFCWNYERPNATAGQESMPARIAFANRVFNECSFDGQPGGGGGVNPNPPSNGSGGVSTPKPETMDQKENEVSYYKVKAGDTLSQIAQSAGADMNQIQKVQYYNIENKNDLQVGQVLYIPNQKKREYKIVSGDTLSGIAQKLGVTTTYLIQENNLANPDKIYVGQYLKY